MREPKEITLPETCRMLGRTWMQAYNLLLTGAIEGRQERGRWKVDRASVERLREAEGAESDANPQVAA